MKNLKNYTYIILSLLYFVIAFVLHSGFLAIPFDVSTFLDYKYSNEILAFVDALFSLILLLYLFNIFEDKFEVKIKSLLKKLKFKNIISNLLIKFVTISKYIISVYIAINVAIIPDSLQDIADKIFNVSFLVAGLLLITTLINSIFKELEKKEGNDSMSQHVFPILNKFGVIFLWVVGIITILSNLGYNISALITGAGVGGLAIALAAQTAVSNIFGAVSVIINRPFKIGDFIAVGNYMGTVKDIGLTYLTLTSKGGNDILIPNENIISSSIENLSKRDNRRVDMTLGLEYSTPNEKITQAVEICKSIFEKYAKDERISNYRVHFDNFGDFSLNILATYFSEIEGLVDHNNMVNEINLEIKKQFEDNQIEIAFPTQKIIK